MIGTPIEQLTSAQIKDELRTLYGTNDFSGCLDQKDLQELLTRTREKELITYGYSYGKLLQVGNEQSPSGVVTLSHGLGDSAHGWEDVARELSRRLPHLLFLLPTAPMRPVTINGGMTMNSWYDIRDGTFEGKREDNETIMKSANYLKSLAFTTTQRYRIPAGRVVYAGFSQGAVISLAAGLTAHIAPAGVAALSGYLGAADDVLAQLRNKTLSVALFHGTMDNIIPISMAQQAKVALEKAGVSSVTLSTYPMEHSSHPKEIDDLETFLQRTLPKTAPSL
uniref:Putative alpha/beta hydrolase n=1 Tax=Trypanosoma congolense (strain IL3000) TaxID=1068625 RepID=G0USN4_TRYCI|nr:putative alpha/beta hydrolase [Trypanosoma congolense IL3000]